MVSQSHFPAQQSQQNFVRAERTSLSRRINESKSGQSKSGQFKKTSATVLVFEPDDTSMKKLCAFLRKNGFRVLSTQRPEGVEFRFKTWPKPDLLIISAHHNADIALKAFNAFSWNPYLAKCPVFLIGANRQKEILTKYAKIDHLRKVILTPFKTELFVRVINSLIRRSQRA
tara:strand:- start:590 stop:1105 length:516 start_codon:yes stop_codon:yes gene_type:complete